MRKIFICGLPSSGRSTVAKAIVSNAVEYIYFEPNFWTKVAFRKQNNGEPLYQYQDAYDDYILNRLKEDPDLYIKIVNDCVKIFADFQTFVIDGILSPRDFSNLFDYNKDTIIFLNRTDNNSEYKDAQSIALSSIRDYCYWATTMGLLDKTRWLEFNFSINTTNKSPLIKKMGSHNTIVLARNIDNVILFLIKYLSSDAI